MSPQTARTAARRPCTGPPSPPSGPVQRSAVPLFRMLALLALLLSFAAPVSAETPRWQWPLSPPHQVLAPFEAPAHRYGPGHRGVDLATHGPGTEVRAVEAGTVHFSGGVAGRGVVSVTHEDGLISTYEPVDGVLEQGAAVEAGMVIGTVESGPGIDHCPDAACLHLGARHGQDYLDPMLLLGARGPSVLLPWAGSPVGGAAAANGGSTGRGVGERNGAVRGIPRDGEGPAGAATVPVPGTLPGPAGGMRATPH